MNKESLEIAIERLHLVVDDPRIDTIDKVELLINIMHFINNYKENIEVLEKHRVMKLTREDDD